MMMQVAKFGIVGIVATAAHMIIGTLLIFSETSPNTANLIAFAAAFGIIFDGHFFYSFKGVSKSLMISFSRFGTVAVTGFLFNQSLLSLLIAKTDLLAAVCLIASTGIAAILTFLLSKFWAFA